MNAQRSTTSASWPKAVQAGAFWLFVGFGIFPYNLPAAVSDEQNAPSYSDEVVAKAETILQKHGMKRSGTLILPIIAAEHSRTLTEETKLKRAAKQARETWQAADQQNQLLEQQTQQLEVQVGELNGQFAAQGNPLGRNNELVARINALTAQLNQSKRLLTAQKEELAKLRGSLGEAEEAYMELVLKLRRQVAEMTEVVRAAGEAKEVAIAFRVLATRYSTPEELDAEAILAPFDRRLRKLEEGVFSESLPLLSENGSLKIRAVIGLESLEMIVDSGSSLVLIPFAVAEQLKIKPEPQAKVLTMATADGRRIQAREIFLSRVRVGQFEAENVRAALLDESFPGAQPLLGLSFLERFRFELDVAQKKLTLLRLETEQPVQ